MDDIENQTFSVRSGMWTAYQCGIDAAV